MDTEIARLTARLERVERSNRTLKAALFGGLLVAIGCGASTTVANYGTVRTHGLEVFTADEAGSVLILGRDATGGRIEVKDAQGKVGLVIDATGVHPAG